MWARAVRWANCFYLEWALAEIDPLHDDVSYIVMRLNDLRRMG
jgi:hypothetical protein